MTLDERIAALPKWPREEDYVKTYRHTETGFQVTYSTPVLDLRFVNDQVDALSARLALVREQLQMVVDELQEARVSIEDWAGYASNYFREKHGLAAELAALDVKIADARKVLGAVKGDSDHV